MLHSEATDEHLLEVDVAPASRRQIEPRCRAEGKTGQARDTNELVFLPPGSLSPPRTLTPVGFGTSEKTLSGGILGQLLRMCRLFGFCTSWVQCRHLDLCGKRRCQFTLGLYLTATSVGP